MYTHGLNLCAGNRNKIVIYRTVICVCNMYHVRDYTMMMTTMMMMGGLVASDIYFRFGREGRLSRPRGKRKACKTGCIEIAMSPSDSVNLAVNVHIL